jgi:hypothetical protein
MPMKCDAFNWRFSPGSEAGLAYSSFYLRGVPVPSIAGFYDNSGETFNSFGAQLVHGYLRLEMIWERFNNVQWNIVYEAIEAAKVAAEPVLYMTVDRSDGSHAIPYWIDIKGYPHRQLDQVDPGPLIGRQKRVHVYNNVILRLNNVSIINDPSLYAT